MTQPVYDEKTIEIMYKSTKHLNVPLFIGIMPLTSLRNAIFLHNEGPWHIRLSQSALNRIGKLEGEAAHKEGINIAQELIECTMKYFHGIYLITTTLHS